MTPTYVPDLVDTCLDLLIDKERGIWHLSSGTAITWAELAQMAADTAGIDASSLEPVPGARMGHLAARPPFCALGTERAVLMPPLPDALERFARLRGRRSADVVRSRGAV